MKAVLVVDIDDDVKNYGVTVYHYPSRSFVHSMDANLKPLPHKMEITKEVFINYVAMDKGYACGWDDCLDAITGGTE